MNLRCTETETGTGMRTGTGTGKQQHPIIQETGIGSSGPQIDFISEVTQATHQSGRYQQMRSRSHAQQPQLDPCRQFPFNADNITSNVYRNKSQSRWYQQMRSRSHVHSHNLTAVNDF
ncbi:hypothetical protein Tco_0834462 [Tanacetum coccineum]